MEIERIVKIPSNLDLNYLKEKLDILINQNKKTDKIGDSILNNHVDGLIYFVKLLVKGNHNSKRFGKNDFINLNTEFLSNIIGKGNSFKNKEHINQNYGEFKQLDDVRKGSTQKYPKSILTVNKPHPSNAKHRTAKPVDLLVNLIKQYSNEYDVVLDNCAGSGSVGDACIKTNRKFILIEKDIIEYNKINLLWKN
jgi:DNA modification methylase